MEGGAGMSELIPYVIAILCMFCGAVASWFYFGCLGGAILNEYTLEIDELREEIDRINDEKESICNIDRRKDNTIRGLEGQRTKDIKEIKHLTKRCVDIQIEHDKFINDHCPGITITKTG